MITYNQNVFSMLHLVILPRVLALVDKLTPVSRTANKMQAFLVLHERLSNPLFMGERSIDVSRYEGIIHDPLSTANIIWQPAFEW